VSKSLQLPLSDLLVYLNEIGYGDLYLRPRTAPAVPAPAPEPVSALPAPAVPGPAAAARIFGSGNPQARLMLVGEGADEGEAGELLTRILQAIELRREDVYLVDVLKSPGPAELAACRAQLEQEVARVQPRVLVALGEVAAQAMLIEEGESPIGRLRGQWHTAYGIPTRVTYPPAALLQDPALKRPAWEDMQQVRDCLRTVGG
jgi:uracil-DNA glycosylase family 4